MLYFSFFPFPGLATSEWIHVATEIFKKPIFCLPETNIHNVGETTAGST